MPELLGRVTDPDGAPVEDVDVTVRPSLNSSFRQVTSAGNGSFGVPGLPVGGVRVMLDFKKDRYAALSKSAVAMPGKGGQVIPPVPSSFTLLRPYLAHFFPENSRFLRVFTAWPRRFQRAASRNPGPRNSRQEGQEFRTPPFVRRPRC